MISETFGDLRFEFQTTIERANQSDNLTDRETLVAQATLVLNRTRKVWQEELTVMKSMLNSLREADRERVRLKAIERLHTNRLG